MPGKPESAPPPPPSQIKTMCPWWPGTWFQPVWGFNSFLHLASVQTVLRTFSSVYRLNCSLYQSSDRALLPYLLLLNVTVLHLKITAASWGRDKRETLKEHKPLSVNIFFSRTVHLSSLSASFWSSSWHRRWKNVQFYENYGDYVAHS